MRSTLNLLPTAAAVPDLQTPLSTSDTSTQVVGRSNEGMNLIIVQEGLSNYKEAKE
jgi:hypothetical protein